MPLYAAWKYIFSYFSVSAFWIGHLGYEGEQCCRCDSVQSKFIDGEIGE